MNQSKILFVDDDPDVVMFYQDYLGRRFALDTALSGDKAIELIQTGGPYAVVIADLTMPEMNGIEFLERCHRLAPDTVRIMLTGDPDLSAAIKAINKGHIFQFLTKPCPPDIFSTALENGVRQYQLLTAERELLEKTLNGIIKMLTEILSLVEIQSFGQSQRVRDYAKALAEAMKVPQRWEVEIAAMLSQIGYITVPASIAQKVRHNIPLQTNEKFVLERIPEIGSKLLSMIPRMESVARMVHYQSKNFDGTGFPHDEVAGERIPVGARILKVVSETVRQEAEGVGRLRALEELRSRPAWYDVSVVDKAVACLVTQGATHVRRGKALSLDQVAVGQTLVENIESVDGMKIVGAGNKISPMLLEKLHNFKQLGYVKEPIFVEE